MSDYKQYLREQAYLMGVDTPDILQGIEKGLIWHVEQLRIIARSSDLLSIDELKEIAKGIKAKSPR